MADRTYLQVRDVLNLVRRYHQRLRDALECPCAATDDPRAELLLDWLRKEEQTFNTSLRKYIHDDADGSVLDTWLQYIADENLMLTLQQAEFRADMPADEIVARKLACDQALIEFYRMLAKQTSVPRVEELFNSLWKETQHHAEQASWRIQEYGQGAEPPRADR